ncbi:hypothetical protein HDG35_003916 [Paraburkholderia sp. JPY681]|nr:hypothetical protein [Paraburkholderia atlantica]
MVEIVQHRLSAREDGGAERRRNHAARGTLEQRATEHIFQFSEGIRDGWLTACHVLGYASKRAMLPYLQQQHEMAHLQACAQAPYHFVRVE